MSTFAVELSALSGAELPGLAAYLRAKPRLPFRYLSVHAPVKAREPDESAAVAMLVELPLWVRSVVTHPDALSNLALYRALGTRLVLENMYDRKVTGRVGEELETFFDELPTPASASTSHTLTRSTQRWTRHTACLIASGRACGRYTSAHSATDTTCRLMKLTNSYSSTS